MARIEPIFETADEIRDTIALCQDFLANATECEGIPTGQIFSADALDFARKQIDFERAKLARLEAENTNQLLLAHDRRMQRLEEK